jgi:hypothetical protein
MFDIGRSFSGVTPRQQERPLYPLKADIYRRVRHVHLVPEAGITPSTSSQKRSLHNDANLGFGTLAETVFPSG